MFAAPTRVAPLVATATATARTSDAKPVSDSLSPPAASLHFLVAADWGGLPVWPWVTPAQRGVAAAMGRVAEAEHSAFCLSLGDHFYFHGVRSAEDKRWRRTFERPFSAPALKAPGFFRVVAGNHDHAGNISAQLAYASRPRSRWRYPALQHAWRETLADEQRTSVAFVLIDTVELCGMPRARGAPPRATRAWAWVERALAAAEDADYIVVGGHYPVHSPSSHGPTACLQRRLQPLLRRHRASVYVSGHDHALFHVTDDGGGAEGGASPVQFHGVGAGFMTTNSRRHAHTCAAQLRFHHRHARTRDALVAGGFAGVRVTSGEGMTVEHIDSEGRTLYSHTVPPRGGWAAERANGRAGKRENVCFA
jgi:tartrate-resistant acid phosphatase type 5